MTILNALKIIGSSLLVAAILSGQANATVLNYTFDVSVGSGSKSGNNYSGNFSADTSGLLGVGQETVGSSSFTFNYPGNVVGAATVFFQDGVFEKIQAVQGDSWGINAGFFGFQVISLCNGQPGCSPASYFAYLNERTFIDGAGPITYSQVPAPGTLVLFGLGLAALASRYCRKQV